MNFLMKYSIRHLITKSHIIPLNINLGKGNQQHYKSNYLSMYHNNNSQNSDTFKVNIQSTVFSFEIYYMTDNLLMVSTTFWQQQKKSQKN